MKILYVITKANFGGAQRYVYNLATTAQAAGHDVAVCVGGTGALTEKLAAQNVRVLSLPLRQHTTFIGDLFSFGPLFPLMRIFRDEQPDVVHVNSAKAGGLGALAARLAQVPRIIFTAHGWEFNAPRGTLSKIGIRFFSWLTMLLAHKTIAVSEAIKHDVIHWPFLASRLTVIHNGIESTALLPRTKARTTLAPQSTASYWIGMISELHPTKRVADAIEAFASVAAHHPDCLLVVMGAGTERSRLETLIRTHDLSDRVILAGFVSDAPHYLSAFDLFLHTSESEALGLAILEAGSAALPVIATQVGGIPEIITDDSLGVLVPPKNPSAIAAAIESLIQDPKRARLLGAILQKRVLEHFSLPAMSAATFALYAD